MNGKCVTEIRGIADKMRLTIWNSNWQPALCTTIIFLRLWCMSTACHVHFAHCCSAWYFERNQHFTLRKTLSICCSLARSISVAPLHISTHSVSSSGWRAEWQTDYVFCIRFNPIASGCLLPHSKALHPFLSFFLLPFFPFSSLPFHFSIAAGKVFRFAFFLLPSERNETNINIFCVVQSHSFLSKRIEVFPFL